MGVQSPSTLPSLFLDSLLLKRSERAKPINLIGMLCCKFVAAESTSLMSIDFREVDVPRFELGASTMPR